MPQTHNLPTTARNKRDPLCAFASSREPKKLSRGGVEEVFNNLSCFVIASEARQSRVAQGRSGLPRRFAPRNDD